MKYIHIFYLWLRSSTNLKVPVLGHIVSFAYITQGKTYLIFNWRVQNAYQLKIKAAGFTSFVQSGSAYVLLNQNVNQVEIIVSNSWKQQKYIISFVPVNINAMIGFPATISKLNPRVTVSCPLPRFKTLKIYPFPVKIMGHRKAITITNLSYEF